MRFSDEKVTAARNFANKVWNASRFALMNLDGPADDTLPKGIADKWILTRLNDAIETVTMHLEQFDLAMAAQKLYDFIWSELCDWYLELAKAPLYGDDENAASATRATLKYVLVSTLKLLHPFMPFVTEEIWQDLAPRAEGASICVAQMPEPAAEDAAMLARFELAKEIITSVRNIRNQKSLPQKEALTLRVIADENYPAEFAPVVMKMANLTAIETVAEKDPAAAAFIVKTTQYFVPMAGKIDAEAERRKLTDELSYQEGFLASVMKKLSNERFVQSAPGKVVANERAKQADAEAKIAAIKAQLEALS